MTESSVHPNSSNEILNDESLNVPFASSDGAGALQERSSTESPVSSENGSSTVTVSAFSRVLRPVGKACCWISLHRREVAAAVVAAMMLMMFLENDSTDQVNPSADQEQSDVEAMLADFSDLTPQSNDAAGDAAADESSTDGSMGLQIQPNADISSSTNGSFDDLPTGTTTDGAFVSAASDAPAAETSDAAGSFTDTVSPFATNPNASESGFAAGSVPPVPGSMLAPGTFSSDHRATNTLIRFRGNIRPVK